MEQPLLHTALHATHKVLGAKMVPFGGWDMPVWYSSVKEEHAAVRNAAGLFDVTHMGVIDVAGPGAAAWLDRMATNDLPKLKLGRSHYSYLLDEAGDVIDDIMIYRIEDQRWLVVINASNNVKDIAWLRAHLPADGSVQLRDLRDPVSANDMRVDMAIQGPASLGILQNMLGIGAAATLAALPFTGIMHATLGAHDVFISRTGYTGERVAYEIFVHPDQSPALWTALLAAGQSAGLKPCGLAARDSLRTEAGLPLYGHELAGPLNLAPFHIGMDNFVKLDTEFIGKAGYIAKQATSNTRMARFRMNEKGVRVAKGGDAVLDKRGRVIGHVTSCAIDRDGFLTGLAMVESAASAVGGALLILNLPEKAPLPLPAYSPLGSRALLPDAATVVSRFPLRAS